MIRLRIIISGRVQKVFFRHTAQKIALMLNLVGWVKNTDEGDVLCEVQGEQILAEQFVSFALHGPSLATVKKVVVEHIKPVSDEEGFQIIS